MFESWVKSFGLVGVVGMVFIGTAADGRTVNLTDGSGADTLLARCPAGWAGHRLEVETVGARLS